MFQPSESITSWLAGADCVFRNNTSLFKCRPGFALETSFSWRTTWSFARQTMKMGWWKKATLLISAEWAKKTKEEKSCWRVIQQSRKKKEKKPKQTNRKAQMPFSRLSCPPRGHTGRSVEDRRWQGQRRQGGRDRYSSWLLGNTSETPPRASALLCSWQNTNK